MFFGSARTPGLSPRGSVFFLRFDVLLGAGTPPALSAPTTGGLVLLAAQPLVLVVDLACLGLANQGATVTNAMDHILGAFGGVAGKLGLNAAALTWVQLASDGYFDLVQPGSRGCTFAPLPSPSGANKSRSRAAFLEAFPDVGHVILEQLSEIVSNERVLH